MTSCTLALVSTPSSARCFASGSCTSIFGRGAGAPDGARGAVLEDQGERGSRRGAASRPDSFSPDASVTVAVTGLAARRRAGAPRAARARHAAGHPHVLQRHRAGRRASRCPAGRRSASGSSRTARRRTSAPALASPTRMFSSVSGPGRRAALVGALRLQAVEPGGDGLDVVDGHRQRRHRRRAGPAVLDHRDDQLPVLVVEHQLRSQQVGTAELTAARVGAVAGAAQAGVLRLAALEQLGRRRGRWWAGKRGGSWKPPAGRGGGAGSPCAPCCWRRGGGGRRAAAARLGRAATGPGRRRAGPARARGRAPSRSSKLDVGTSGPFSLPFVWLTLHVTTSSSVPAGGLNRLV